MLDRQVDEDPLPGPMEPGGELTDEAGEVLAERGGQVLEVDVDAICARVRDGAQRGRGHGPALYG